MIENFFFTIFARLQCYKLTTSMNSFFKYLLPVITIMVGLSVSSLYAQTRDKVLVCGFPAQDISEWRKEYQANKDQYISLRSNNDLLTLPLVIHIIGDSNGDGYYELNDLMVTLCVLNESFADLNVQFIIDDIRYHNNTNWYNHETQSVGFQMAQSTGVSNRINIWIANAAAGALGYAQLGSNRIWVAKSAIRGRNSSTLTHEMGHALDMLHTFNGWESTTYEEGNQAPAFVSGIPVERVDRTNCSIAGDRICDTESDFLGFRWPCNSDGLSSIVQIDPRGVEFQSEGSNYMSYASDVCTSTFSEEQKDIMRSHILSVKNNMLVTSSNIPDPAFEPITEIFPVDNGEAHFENVRLSWRASENAHSYRVQLSRFSSFAIRLIDEVVTDTSFVFNGELDEGRTYFWQVSPISDTDFCAESSGVLRFRAVSSTATIELEGNHFSIAPSLLTASNELFLSSRLSRSMLTDFRVINIQGKTVWSQKHQLHTGTDRIRLGLPQLPAGMYFLNLSNEAGQYSFKFVKQ